MNSSTHPGGFHQLSFHTEHSSNTFRTSEASSEMIYVMILVVEIQYQVDKKNLQVDPVLLCRAPVSDMDGSICDTEVIKERARTNLLKEAA